jgi:peptide/nickel transport system permease protein
MLGLVILLSIFGLSIKTYRAIFMQVKESPYVDAARAYGASDRRIIFRYLIPRILPLIIPAIVVLVPSYVFLEASLAVLGLGDPVLPTWGKVINDASTQGALFNGYYYWILLPSFLLILSGLAFAMVGFALDRVFNPRLREV